MVIISGPRHEYSAATDPTIVVQQIKRQHEKRRAAINSAQIEAVGAMADKALEVVKERTGAGQDYKRQPLAPYSNAYARRKGKSTPDMTLSGEMMGSLRVYKAANRPRAILTFDSLRSRKKVRGHARGNWPIPMKSGGFKWLSELGARQPKRRIMGFANAQDKEKLDAAGWSAFRKAMRSGLAYRK